MNWLRNSVLPFMFCLSATSAHAEASAEEFLRMIDSGNSTFKLVLNSYVNGMDWANTSLQLKTGKRLYCKPDRLPETEDQNVAILRQLVEKLPSAAKQPAGLAMFFALKYAFPCPDGLGI